MLEKFKFQVVLNSFYIFGGANTSDILIIEEDVVGLNTNSDDDFIIDDVDGL